ncbi:unnamed protein product [Phaedon cochleariae]|uniref:Caspase-3 n=1 Tax=Phaedon cochleariae TaxID=80249 RepID=A0A9P0DU51_PHACE|nr:unnamed protein product [Phaedon cochleariae]
MTSERDAKGFIRQVLTNPSTSRTSTSTSPKKKIAFDFSREENTNVKHGKYGTFKERQNLAIDEKFEYKRDGNEPGLVIIFNHENFESPDLKPRRGSRRDVNEIITCKQRQGINISEDNILTDATTKEISDKLKQVADMDLKEYNFLIVYFLTHGDYFNKLHTKDGTVKAHDIWEHFRKCRSLENKPKMFVFQACKGDKFTTTGTSSEGIETPNIVPYSAFKTEHLAPDMLVVYSTLEGRFSYRNPLTGSWFIQELCKNINTYGKRDDVISLLTRTAKCVSGNYYHEGHLPYEKQMPIFISTLSKKFYLNRNKDRDHLLKTVENYQKTVEELEMIKHNLKTLLRDK